MKKLSIFIVLLFLLLSLFGCGGDKTASNNNENSSGPAYETPDENGEREYLSLKDVLNDDNYIGKTWQATGQVLGKDFKYGTRFMFENFNGKTGYYKTGTNDLFNDIAGGFRIIDDQTIEYQINSLDATSGAYHYLTIVKVFKQDGNTYLQFENDDTRAHKSGKEDSDGNTHILGAFHPKTYILLKG